MGVMMVDKNIAYLDKRNRIRHILTGPAVDYVRICRLTDHHTRRDKCPKHNKTDCLDLFVKYEDAVNEVADALIGRRL